MADGNGSSGGPVWFVTGASSGFGQAMSRTVLARGYRVVPTARRIEDVSGLADEYPGRALPVQLDVTDRQAIDQAVEAAVEYFGGIDVVFNNAGYGHVGAVEELSDDEIRQQFAVNLFGIIDVTRAVLPKMREQGSGHLVQMSSLNGVEGLVGGAYYAASKFAIEGLSESLADEVAHLGIGLTIVEPGPHRTRFLDQRSAKSTRPMSAYDASVGQSRELLDQLNGNQPGDPDRAAEAIITAVEADAPPRRLPLGQMALDNIRTKLSAQLEELEAWAELSATSDFPSDDERDVEGGH